MPTVRCNGVELHVERRGSGPKLLFCNGSGTTVATSQGLLERWAQSFELLCGAHPPAGETAEEARGRQLQLKARSQHDVLDRLGRIACPTWVAHGRHDGIAPLANGQAIVDRVPQASLHSFDGGHAFFLQDPLAWPELVAFLHTQTP